MNKPKIKLIVVATAALLAELIAPIFVGTASAAVPVFAQAFVRPDHFKALTGTALTVCATPTAATTALTEDQVVIVIPTDAGATDFTLDSNAAHWTAWNDNLPAGSTFWPGMTSGTTHATSVSGHTVTFPSGDLTVAGGQVCFKIAGLTLAGAAVLTNGSTVSSTGITGGTFYSKVSSGPTIVNQTNWAYTVTTDDTIVVSAVVPPNFTLALDAYTDAFTTNLDPTAIVSTAGRTATISTNAPGGWIAWAKDLYSGLHSATSSYTIASGLMNPYPTQTKFVGNPFFDLVPSGGGVGREGYVMDVTINTDATGGCTVGTDAAYGSTTGSGGGVLDNTAYEPIASCTGTAPATSDGDILNLVERAVIRGGTPAGTDYTDSITVVGAGNF